MKFPLNSFPGRRILTGVLGIALAAWTAAPLVAADAKPKIPIIVKDTTSFFWQIVLSGARKAGQDLNVDVPELGAQSESDINGQISILENAVSEKPAAIVISPTQFKALGQPIDEAAKTKAAAKKAPNPPPKDSKKASPKPPAKDDKTQPRNRILTF